VEYNVYKRRSKIMKLKEENIAIAEVLIDYIKDHGNENNIKISYKEFCNKLWTEKHLRVEPFRIGNYLGQISAYFHAYGLPFMSAIVVNSNTQMPGIGFYELLHGYGIIDVTAQYKEIEKAQTFKDYQKLYDCLYNVKKEGD
jgi:hypothetical protein